MIERHIDYLQFQASIPQSVCIFNEFESVSGIAFYPKGYRDGLGGRYYFGNPKSKLCLFVASGEAMERRRQWGYADTETIDWALSHGAKFSRVDWAITDYIDESLVTVSDVQSWFENEKIKSSLTAHGAKFISGYADEMRKQVQTLYIGDMKKRAKRGIFRAYDKGIEQGLDAEIITRLELEERGDNADMSCKRFSETASFSGVFRSRFDVDALDFERLVDAPALGVQRGQGKMKTEKEMEMEKRFNWLMEQIAPALKEFVAYEAENDPTMTRTSQFIAMSGLQAHMKDVADKLAKSKYRDMLSSNELIERPRSESD